MSVKKNNRYFRVSYYCVTVNGREGSGSIGAIAADGRYVNEMSLIQKICNIQKAAMPDDPFAQVLIGAIFELNEADYNDFYGKDANPDTVHLTFSSN